MSAKHSPIRRGQRFNRLLALKRARRDTYGNDRWLFRCDCGAPTVARVVAVRSGATKSCGCGRNAHHTSGRNLGPRNGRFIDGRTAMPEYAIWRGMHRRCRSVRKGGHKNYGGRGIKVCRRWARFENFLADVRRRPSPLHTIDRLNNDGDYRPGNVRWATRRQQNRNRRITRRVKFRGRQMPFAAACRLAGIKYGTAHRRVRQGWAAHRALTTIVRSY